MPDPARDAIDGLMDLLRRSEQSEYIGESVSQLQHALQAADAATRAGASEVEVAAALLHDVGHLCASEGAARMESWGVDRHEDVGAGHLADLGFGESVCALVRGHVAAKRYLVATRPDYAARLSTASTRTLAHQGGPMSPEEVTAFDTDERRDAVLRVRSWDEAAKVPDARVPDLESYRPLLERLLAHPE